METIKPGGRSSVVGAWGTQSGGERRSAARAHKSPRLQKLLEAHGCRLWYLPTYSPDFSPIELAFSKIKAELRKVGARTKAALEAAVAQALTHISPAEARAFFVHCGFRLQPDLSQWFCS
jgi:transposase